MLFPEKIEEVWQDYPFPIDTHFLDAKIISKIKWYSEQSIDVTGYLARPMIFLKADGYKTEKLRELEVYTKATILAHAKGRGFYTSLITNGTRLAQEALRLVGSTDLIWVSLDHDTTHHDETRDGDVHRNGKGIDSADPPKTTE